MILESSQTKCKLPKKMKYWKIDKTNRRWLYLCSPIMDSNVSFVIKRGLVEELRLIEKTLQYPTRGWVISCALNHPHIMIMLLKFGAIPYSIEKKTIWFKKEL